MINHAYWGDKQIKNLPCKTVTPRDGGVCKAESLFVSEHFLTHYSSLIQRQRLYIFILYLYFHTIYLR